jgi:hypothetical protein
VEPRVLGERLPMQWRISRDEWDRLVAADPAVDASIEQQIAGWTVIVDDALPPGSVLFEER